MELNLLKIKNMQVKIKVFQRKSNHYNLPEGEQYDITEKFLTGDSEQEILDKFYVINKRGDMSYYHKFADDSWEVKLIEWYGSADHRTRSFELYYGNGIVD